MKGLAQIFDNYTQLEQDWEAAQAKYNQDREAILKETEKLSPVKVDDVITKDGVEYLICEIVVNIYDYATPKTVKFGYAAFRKNKDGAWAKRKEYIHSLKHRIEL